MKTDSSRMRFIAVGALVLALAAILVGCSGTSKSEGPTTITVWTYYNGNQLAAFNKLVDEFNATEGSAKGIVVKSQNLGSVEDLQDAVNNSARGKVGAQPLPNIFSAYADSAYAIDEMGLLANLTPYLSEAERARYVDGYLDEGVFGDGDAIKIFPVAKSVEVLMVNETDFEPFAQETGVTTADLQTFEGIAQVAEKYYAWTDAQTEEPNDGKALFGIDSMANYFFIGAKQMGVSFVERKDDGTAVLNFDKQTARRLWDNFYVPFIKGYYAASGRYRSDDVKTGNIIALLGSSSSATYFPSAIVADDGTERPIELGVYPSPQFANGEKWAVQQGAGMSVIDASQEEVKASVTFLQWFTSPEQNIAFSVSSGYLPVMKESSSIDVVRNAHTDITPHMEQVLVQGFVTIEDNQLYSPPAFEGGSDFRKVLERSLFELAVADAEDVRSALGPNTTAEQAAAPYLTDAYFETWYNKTLSDLEAAVK